MMLATRCSCGFERLEDEEVSDHLLAIFESADGIGTDGLLHQEEALRHCSCGFSATIGPELDTHFLAVFTPPDATAPDAKKHQPLSIDTAHAAPAL